MSCSLEHLDDCLANHTELALPTASPPTRAKHDWLLPPCGHDLMLHFAAANEGETRHIDMWQCWPLIDRSAFQPGMPSLPYCLCIPLCLATLSPWLPPIVILDRTAVMLCKPKYPRISVARLNLRKLRAIFRSFSDHCIILCFEMLRSRI